VIACGIVRGICTSACLNSSNSPTVAPFRRTSTLRKPSGGYVTDPRRWHLSGIEAVDVDAGELCKSPAAWDLLKGWANCR
jgi:hypothetical protein